MTKQWRLTNMLWSARRSVVGLVGVCVLVSFAGCAVENENWGKRPPFSMRSDKIAGLTTPSERREAIREKGNRGKVAPTSEQEVLLGQLVLEYQSNPDPNLRRDTVEAIGKIPHSSRDAYLEEALADKSPFVRISACRELTSLTALCRAAEKETDKDVQIVVIKRIGQQCGTRDSLSEGDKKTVLTTLAAKLNDKAPSIRYAAMDSLHKATGRDYGVNIDSWTAYVDYALHGQGQPPEERAFRDKLPTIQLPMLK
ncbi:MAG: HEAT repeat domain-containing protein [Thermoguttaceae bacterium]